LNIRRILPLRPAPAKDCKAKMIAAEAAVSANENPTSSGTVVIFVLIICIIAAVTFMLKSR
jgi:hypothetical protein